MWKKHFGVGLMAAILKFKMVADRGRYLSGTRPEMNQYPKTYLCVQFGAFIPICTIFPLSAGLMSGGVCVEERTAKYLQNIEKANKIIGLIGCKIIIFHHIWKFKRGICLIWKQCINCIFVFCNFSQGNIESYVNIPAFLSGDYGLRQRLIIPRFAPEIDVQAV
jgi:hypothetical protein